MVSSHGSGYDYREDWVNGEWKHGENTVIEGTAKLFNHRNIVIGKSVYVGHNVILAGYIKNTKLVVGDSCWIGAGVYINAAGGVEIQSSTECPVGIGPGVTILTSEHDIKYGNPSVMLNPLIFSPVVVERGADIGSCSVILPGVTIGEGAVVGAGSIVTRDIPSFEIWCGNPARLLRKR